MTITTPSGFIVELADFLTFGQRRELDKIAVSSATVSDNKMSDIPASVVYAMQDKAFELLVKQITVDGVVVKENLYQIVMSWREDDGRQVFEEINRITSPKDQKKSET